MTPHKRKAIKTAAYLIVPLILGCTNTTSNFCHQEEYTYQGVKFGVAYISDVNSPNTRSHLATMKALGDEVFPSKEAMLHNGFKILSCRTTNSSVEYCSGQKQITEIRTRTICPNIGSSCRDGTFSSSTGQGTCSHHEGIAK